MDIRKFALKPTATIHLRDGADNLLYADDAGKKPMQVHVHGPGTKVYAAAEKRNNEKIVESMRRKGKPMDSAEMRVDFLVAITKGFDNVEYDGLQGEELYRAVYSDPEIRFIADQVYAYVNEMGNFTKTAATS